MALGYFPFLSLLLITHCEVSGMQYVRIAYNYADRKMKIKTLMTNQIDIGDIKSTSSNIGCNQYSQFPQPEAA